MTAVFQTAPPRSPQLQEARTLKWPLWRSFPRLFGRPQKGWRQIERCHRLASVTSFDQRGGTGGNMGRIDLGIA